ncbi:MAG: hypothetical protein JEZ14_06445 [Marinilabiliaceae bacterium]|nr:hypothetical protein [Marinilabiliaceae bacterium]
MEITTNFSFSIPELAQRADKILISFDRDLAHFAGYGYDGAIRDKVGLITSQVKVFPSDDYYEGNQKVKTNEKRKIRDELEADINDLLNRAHLVYGPKSMEYGLFKYSRTTEMSDNELVQYALHVIQIAQPRLEDLKKRQVSQEHINAIMTKRNGLDSAIDEQAGAVSLRKDKTVQRKHLANDLYKLISEVCEVGKMIWKGKNEAFYADYVIYEPAKVINEQIEEGVKEE